MSALLQKGPHVHVSPQVLPQQGPCLGSLAVVPSKSLFSLEHSVSCPRLSPLILPGLQGRPDSGITSSLKPSCDLAVFQDNHPSSIKGRVKGGPLPVRSSGPPNSSFSAWNFPRVSVRMDSRCPQTRVFSQILHCSGWKVQTRGCLSNRICTPAFF